MKSKKENNKDTISVFWFRRDLRLDDNAGLFKALKAGGKVLPIFIFDKNILDNLEIVEDKRVSFIYHRIKRLKAEIQALGSDLRIFYSTPMEVFSTLEKEFLIDTIYLNRDYEPYARSRDTQISNWAKENSIKILGAKDHVIFEKNEVLKADGTPYLVYTPYSKKWKEKLNDFYQSSYPTKKYINNFYSISEKQEMPSLEFMGFSNTEHPEVTPEIPLKTIEKYSETRDYPGLERGTTHLGIHLRFGTLSIRTLVREYGEVNKTFLNELIWRDFYQMILFHYPESPQKAIKPAYDRLLWRNNEDDFQKWKSGETGFPIVDAGMRELNQTGYMHNRVRMIVASFLTKHLLIDWRWGERYFAEKLLDYELASNVGGWQWASGSGCDAAPYFRIFNPESQTEKFDPDKKYIKKWVPNFNSPSYPPPMVNHKEARERALAFYKEGLSQ